MRNIFLQKNNTQNIGQNIVLDSLDFFTEKIKIEHIPGSTV